MDGQTKENENAMLRKLMKEIISKKKRIQCRNCGKFEDISTSRCNEKEAPTSSSSENVDVGGQSSTRHQQVPERIVHVASLQSKANGVFIDAIIDGKLRTPLALLNTGATKTIIWSDIVKQSTKIVPAKWRLRMATGDPATIHGEANISFVIGSTSFKHSVLVADIEDELILGMDIMNMKGLELNFKCGRLKINNEEIVLHQKDEETARVVLAEDTLVLERSEAILNAFLDKESMDRTIMMFEPRSHDADIGKEIALGKTLIQTAKTVPVRVMNTNCYSVSLKKGTVVGYCSPVSSIIPKVRVVEESNGCFPGERNGEKWSY